MTPYCRFFPNVKISSFDCGAFILFLSLFLLWNFLRRRAATVFDHIQENPRPLKGILGPAGHLKALFSWIFLFMRVFAVSPGLYFLNARDDHSPLLVTANNFLTVFLLARRIGKRNIRLLVVDTEGINVWCSAGKGRFSAREIIHKATLSGLMDEPGGKVKIILPKFSLAGVSLSELHRAGLDPIIGPLYAKHLPAFLDTGAFGDCVEDHVDFGLRSRVFTALPTAVQFFYYALGAYVLTFFTAPFGLVWMAASLAFAYPLLLPFLPGRMFAMKGLSLAVAVSAAGVFFSGLPDLGRLSHVCFIFATCLFIALSYTGNSATSSYSGVRKETILFLPVTILLYMLSIFLHFS